MNLLGFIAIVIAVTGVVWLLQLFFQYKGRIDINLSIGRGNLSKSEKADATNERSNKVTNPTDSQSILGDVVLTGSPQSKLSSANAQFDKTELSGKSVNSNQSDDKPESSEAGDHVTDDAYIDQALADESFEDYTSESILKENEQGIRLPSLGQITLSPFANITNQLPSDSFTNSQTPEQIEAMFDLLRESTRRIEQQMMALYAVVRTQALHPTSQVISESTEADGLIDQQNDENLTKGNGEVNVYDFDDDDSPDTSFGSGLDQQLGNLSDEQERGAEYISVEELGGELPEDACKTYDLSEIMETEEEQPKELLPYLASLNKTGELSHDIVESIKKKAPTKIVRHRVRQLIRAIDHYRLNNDANAAIRVTAVMSQLPTDLGKYAASIYDIGRKFGLAAPEELSEPIEADEPENE